MRAWPLLRSALEFGDAVHWWRLCFFILWNVFAFASCQAVICCLAAVSALIPMAQMKPSSSRAYRSDDLSLVFVACRQLAVAFVPMLGLPGYLLNLLRHSLVGSSAHLVKGM